MNKTLDASKCIQIYSDEPISEMLLENIILSSGFKVLKAESPTLFFDQWHKDLAVLNLLDITHIDDITSVVPEEIPLSPSPIWLIADPLTFSENLNIKTLSDEFISRPMTPDIFNLACAFWLESSLKFAPEAIEKLLHYSGKELVIKILHSFNESLQTTINEILPCMNQKDLVGTAKASHSIKASAKLVGAETLYTLCQWLEIKKRHHSPISEKFVEKAKQVLFATQKQYQDFASIPVEQLIIK